jgi:hypothetical protein
LSVDLLVGVVVVDGVVVVVVLGVEWVERRSVTVGLVGVVGG